MLPPESVVVLNIPYWGAGVQPWCLGSGHKDFPHAPSISDQKLEVFCVYSSFHIAQMQVKNFTTYVTLFIYWALNLWTQDKVNKGNFAFMFLRNSFCIVVVDHLLCKFCKLLFWKTISDCCHWSCFEYFLQTFCCWSSFANIESCSFAWLVNCRSGQFFANYCFGSFFSPNFVYCRYRQFATFAYKSSEKLFETVLPDKS